MKNFKHKLTGTAVLLIFLTASACYADRVCLEKATGKLIEYQSGNINDPIALDGIPQEQQSAHVERIKNNRRQSMINNALSRGYKSEDIEFREITAAEWQAIDETQIKAPAREKAEQEAAIKLQKEALLKAKFGWTDEDLKALKEIFKK